MPVLNLWEEMGLVCSKRKKPSGQCLSLSPLLVLIVFLVYTVWQRKESSDNFRPILIGGEIMKKLS